MAIVAFALAMALFGLGETLLAPTIGPMINDLAPEHLRGRYNGACALASTSGYVLGPAVAGLVLAAGHAAVLLLGLATACGLVAAQAFDLERECSSRSAEAATRPARVLAEALA